MVPTGTGKSESKGDEESKEDSGEDDSDGDSDDDTGDEEELNHFDGQARRLISEIVPKRFHPPLDIVFHKRGFTPQEQNAICATIKSLGTVGVEVQKVYACLSVF